MPQSVIAPRPPRRQLRVGVHRAPPGRRHQFCVDLLAADRFLRDPAACQLRKRADRGQYPLATGCRKQGSGLAEKRQER